MNIKSPFIFIGILYAVASAANATPQAPTLQNSVEKYDPGLTATDLDNELKNEQKTPSSNQIVIKNNRSNPSATEQNDLQFKCHKIILEGNKVFSTAKLERLYQDKLNSNLTLANLDSIANSITDYYRKAGYILSQAIIPPQEIDEQGIVHIHIIEGYIDKVSIQGCTSANVCKLLQKYGHHIAKNPPTKLSTLERYAFLANDIPGVKVRVVLNKSEKHAGAADLTFIVEEKTYGGYAGYNNYNNTVLGRQQFIANILVNNLMSASETAVNGIVSRNTDRLQYISLTHRQQFNSRGWGGRLAISAIKTDPNMNSIGLINFIIPGKALIASASTEYAWIRSYRLNLYVGGGFKFLNSITTFGGATLFKDNIRSINLYTSYNIHQSANTYNNVILNFTQGLNFLDAQGNPPSRVGEDIDFSKFDIYASTSHKFGQSKFSTVFALKAQYAFNIVPSSETFTYGGIPFGYGYEPAEFAGDRGIDGILELQYQSFSFTRCKYKSQIFGFFDFGFVWNVSNNIQPSRQSGASTGLGYRVNAMQHLNMDFVIAAPLKPSKISGNPNYVRLLFNFKIYA